jgi:hypothetical protein
VECAGDNPNITPSLWQRRRLAARGRRDFLPALSNAWRGRLFPKSSHDVFNFKPDASPWTDPSTLSCRPKAVYAGGQFL